MSLEADSVSPADMAVRLLMTSRSAARAGGASSGSGSAVAALAPGAPANAGRCSRRPQLASSQRCVYRRLQGFYIAHCRAFETLRRAISLFYTDARAQSLDARCVYRRHSPTDCDRVNGMQPDPRSLWIVAVLQGGLCHRRARTGTPRDAAGSKGATAAIGIARG